jgi:hypothetical protein
MTSPRKILLKELEGIDVGVNSDNLNDLLDTAYECNLIGPVDESDAITIYRIVALALSFGGSPLPDKYKI